MSEGERFEGDLDFRSDGTAWLWTGAGWVCIGELTREEWAAFCRWQWARSV